jgi:hypothetical protein
MSADRCTETADRCTETAERVERVDLSLRRGELPASKSRVYQFADLMERGVEFPPCKIAWSDGFFEIREGVHRAAASIACGYSHLPAVIVSERTAS